MLGAGTAASEAPQRTRLGSAVRQPALADLDADGDLDLATANWHSGDVRVEN